jgi:transcriptional regulator with XRE-family HTH domain
MKKRAGTGTDKGPGSHTGADPLRELLETVRHNAGRTDAALTANFDDADDDGADASGPGQDPHALTGARDNVLEVAIGREVRAFRKKLGITVSDLARATGLSLGMLSKIENGVTSASLTTLQRLSRALGVPVTALFRRFEERRDAVFVSAGRGLVIERRGTRSGHQYQLLGHTGGTSASIVVEPYLITLTEKSDVFPLFQHSGLEFLYMLEGEVIYRHADKLYTMRPGDSLFFDADAPHGPEEMTKLPIRFLSVISYPRERDGE